LLLQSHKEWDLILVDSSNPATTDWKYNSDIIGRIKLGGHRYKYVRDDTNKGVAHSRNVAIKEDDFNDVCIRIDDDSILDIDYIKNLASTYEKKTKEGIKVGGIGGVVPLLGAPVWERNSKDIKMLNEVKFNIEGTEFTLGDEGAFTYYPNVIVESHHLRSSFLFSKKAAFEGGLHPEYYGMTGFREETDFCLRMLMKGYKFFTDTSAICWHQMAPSGGVRTKDYREQVRRCDEHFKKLVIKWRKNGRLKL